MNKNPNNRLNFPFYALSQIDTPISPGTYAFAKFSTIDSPSISIDSVSRIFVKQGHCVVAFLEIGCYGLAAGESIVAEWHSDFNRISGGGFSYGTTIMGNACTYSYGTVVKVFDARVSAIGDDLILWNHNATAKISAQGRLFLVTLY